MGTIRFTDSIGSAILHNGKPWPASRFANWAPVSQPVGDNPERLADGVVVMVKQRDDYMATLELPRIPSLRGNNLAKQSETLDNAYWTKTNVSVSADADAGFDGAVVGDRIIEDGTTGTHYIARSSTPITITAGALLAYSHILKAATRSWCRLRVLDGATTTDAFGAYFDLANGIIGTTATAGNGVLRRAYIEPCGNGYYRCVIVGSLPIGRTTAEIRTMLATADGASSYAGDAASYIIGAGAQLEELGGALAATLAASPYLLTTSAAVAGVSMQALADRLHYHLMNGGSCAVYPGDAALSAYATCGWKKDSQLGLRLTDRRTLEYTLGLTLLNIAGSPVPLLAYYAEQ